MGYCIMRIMKKYSDYSSLSKAYERICGGTEALSEATAAESKKEVLVKAMDMAGNPATYGEIIRERLKNLEYYRTHKLRIDAVIALELLVSFSREDLGKVDLEKWKQENVRWLKETFDRNNPENGDNVISVVYCRSES